MVNSGEFARFSKTNCLDFLGEILSVWKDVR